jgi:hypothetical protein
MWVMRPARSYFESVGLIDDSIEWPSEDDGGEPVSQSATSAADLVLCHICERRISSNWFERHSKVCADIHAQESSAQAAQDELVEVRNGLHEKLDALLHLQSSANTSTNDLTVEPSPLSSPVAPETVQELKRLLQDFIAAAESSIAIRIPQEDQNSADSNPSIGAGSQEVSGLAVNPDTSLWQCPSEQQCLDEELFEMGQTLQEAISQKSESVAEMKRLIPLFHATLEAPPLSYYDREHSGFTSPPGGPVQTPPIHIDAGPIRQVSAAKPPLTPSLRAVDLEFVSSPVLSPRFVPKNRVHSLLIDATTETISAGYNRERAGSICSDRAMSPLSVHSVGSNSMSNMNRTQPPSIKEYEI